jgi:hypothetical protein
MLTQSIININRSPHEIACPLGGKVAISQGKSAIENLKLVLSGVEGSQTTNNQ